MAATRMPRYLGFGVLALLSSLALFLGGPPRAEAIAAGCQTLNTRAQLMITADGGEKNRIAAGYRRGNDQLRVRDRGLNPPFNFGGCPGPYSQVSMVLGDRNDVARLDAKDAALQGDNFKPLPGGIDASLRGNRGSDNLIGHRGHDILRGGPGDDRLAGFARHDLLDGDRGADAIKAVDGFVDIVRCGEGNDSADVDPQDNVRGCEVVRIH